MDILIPDSWLREYLETSATPKQIQEALSLCGPSVERLHKVGSDYVYGVEVTTNRVDMMSIIGLAFEAVAILPRFKYKANLKKDPYKQKLNLLTKSKVDYLDVKLDKALCLRFSAVLINNVKIGKSPDWLVKRLELIGLRGINNIVDISNYLMIEMGQPVHTFDYDKIKNHKMVLRESRKGEKVTTLDNKEHVLLGGDIVMEDGSGKLIDLCGIMGGANSAVDANTKNVLLFVQTYEPNHIRKTSMSLAHRTAAATLFEKGLPTENVLPTLKLGVEMISKLAGGKPRKQVLDILNASEKLTSIKFDEPLDGFINKRLGVDIEYAEIVKILKSLEIIVKSKTLVEIPWVRKLDLVLPEDIVEEVARLYGYHNLPSEIMEGELPINQPSIPFELEKRIKTILKGFGANEIYTLSLVSKEDVNPEISLKLNNPLGSDAEYLRTSLIPSLVKAAKDNSHETNNFHLFEMANIYLTKKNDLPEEVMTLAGIFANTDFRKAKGFVEALLNELNIEFKAKTEDSKFFRASSRNVYEVGSEKIGEFGILESGFIYYGFIIEKLNRYYKSVAKFREFAKYPAQIEDLTITLPEKTKIGELIASIEDANRLITEVSLKDTYEDSFTFRLNYQNPTKTLTDKDVEEVRNQVLKVIKERFGGSLKA